MKSDAQRRCDHAISDEWTVEVAAAGFERIETLSFDVRIPFTHEQWRGRMRTCNAIGTSIPDATVADFERPVAQLLGERNQSSLRIVAGARVLGHRVD